MIKNPLLRPLSLIVVGLALSIGWGIRGNYGHETGAMFPGALAAMAACLLSGRDDWYPRVAYFGLFGMLGWALGGSISYMMIIGYAHSGHATTQLFGYGSLFLVGFLWAGFGGASTAIPAVLTDKQLRAFFLPLSTVLAVWVALYFLKIPLLDFLQTRLELDGIATPMQRQERALYWLDSDWLQVSIILASLLIFDVVQRQFEEAWQIFAYAAVGGLACYLLFLMLHLTIGNEWLITWFVQSQGSFEDRYTAEQLAVTNWPQLFLYLGKRDGLFYPGESLALLSGACLGVFAYFARFGKFAHGSGLLVWTAAGWLIGFVLLPVVGSLFLSPLGGLRMTPPRGDNWAGVLGGLLGGFSYCWRQNQKMVVIAGMVCGTLGGIAFSGATWTETMLVSFGNRNLTVAQEEWTEWQETTWQPSSWTDGERMPSPDFLANVAAPQGWEAWQHQNWHSYVEQSYGFFNGIGLAIALGILSTRVPRQAPVRPGSRWMLLLALVLVLPVLTYVNMIKNLRDWGQDFNGHQALPSMMAIPWTRIELSSLQWFNLVFLIGTLAFIATLIIHWRRPIELFSSSWIGRGQLLFLTLMWVFLVGNFSRALSAFTASRILTEGILYLNAVLASCLILLLPSVRRVVAVDEKVNTKKLAFISATALLICAITFPSLEWWSTRRVYGDAHSGKRGMDFRFGPNANWKRAPMIKGELHR
ncbi:MAG: hypothetical protein GY768_05065 [Planctomycetaceae bacterium]|nr:hypothetical protein [Planctomycetaceae bacterium]